MSGRASPSTITIGYHASRQSQAGKSVRHVLHLVASIREMGNQVRTYPRVVLDHEIRRAACWKIMAPLFMFVERTSRTRRDASVPLPDGWPPHPPG
jgi:hypothetical protein